MAMFKALTFLLLLCSEIHEITATDKNSSFSFNGFVKSPIFNKNIALFGDSKLVKDSSSIQFTNSISQSEGRVIYKKPIKLKERNLISFSSYLTFSMFNEIDDVLAFVMFPSSLDLSLFDKKGNISSSLGFLLQYAKNETVLAFEFSVSKMENLARILIGKPESAKIRNISFVGDLMIRDGERLNCMIEYEESSKRMLVRFRKSGSIKLFDPFFSFLVDLGKLWNDGEVVLCLSSVNGDSSKAHFLHSWSFEVRHLPPIWMHSVPLVPSETLKHNISMEKEEDRERIGCSWRLLGVLVFGLVCGGLGTMLFIYLWTILCVKRSTMVVPEECIASIEVVAVEECKK